MNWLRMIVVIGVMQVAVVLTADAESGEVREPAKGVVEESEAREPAVAVVAESEEEGEKGAERVEGLSRAGELLVAGLGEEVDREGSGVGLAPVNLALPRGVWVLFFGAAVVLVLGWLIQRYRNYLLPSSMQVMRHVQTMKIGSRHYVSLIEVENRRLLIGVSDGSVKLLADLRERPGAANQKQEVSREERSEALEQRWSKAMENALREGGVEGYGVSEQGLSEQGELPPGREDELERVMVGMKKLEQRYGVPD